MSSQVPREPSNYQPTTHAVQQSKHRKIDFKDVAQVIQEGATRPTHKDDCYLFISELPHYNDPIGVVANIQNGNILTVEYRRE